MTAAANATATLIVEDAWLIRSTAADALGDAGFAVHEAQHAAEAISILEARHNDIHVIFTDVTMPGDMDGVGLAHHAAQHWPRIGLIVVSDKPLHLQPPLPDSARFVHKPYVMSQVVKHIRELRAAA